MEFGPYVFGSIEIDGVTYDHDVVIEGGRIRKRKKGPSKSLRGGFGHTPLTAAEDIPWSCRRLVVGTGASGSLPVIDDVIADIYQHWQGETRPPTAPPDIALAER